MLSDQEIISWGTIFRQRPGSKKFFYLGFDQVDDLQGRYFSSHTQILYILIGNASSLLHLNDVKSHHMLSFLHAISFLRLCVMTYTASSSFSTTTNTTSVCMAHKLVRSYLVMRFPNKFTFFWFSSALQ